MMMPLLRYIDVALLYATAGARYERYVDAAAMLMAERRLRLEIER